MNTSSAAYTVFLILSICLSSLIACRQTTTIAPVLHQAETFMSESSDSALLLLEAIQSPEKQSAEDYATWCLLLTQARDKNYLEHTSDSVINIAVRYFEKKSNMKRKAQAYYYKGRVNEDLGLTDNALINYLKAADFVQNTGDYHLQGLIYMYLGNIYWYLNNNREALDVCKRAYDAFLLDKDTINSAYILRNMGRNYTAILENDTAVLCLNQALDIAKLYNKISLQGNIETDLANVYEENKEYNKALEYALSAITHTKSESGLYPCFVLIGGIYKQLLRLDSAQCYLKKALSSDDLYTKAAVNWELAALFKEKGDDALVSHYLSAYIDCQDSINILYDAPRLKELEMLYSKEKVEREKDSLIQDKKVMRMWIALCLFVIITFVVSAHLLYQEFLKNKEAEVLAIAKEADEYKKKYIDNCEEIKEKKQQIEFLESSLSEKECQLITLKGRMPGMKPFLQGETENSSMMNDATLKNQKLYDLNQETTELNQKIEQLNKDVLTLSKKNASLVGLLLKSSEIKEAIAKSVEQNQVLTPNLWIKIQEKIREIDINFLRRLMKEAPTLTPKEMQLCCLIKLNIPLSQMAVLLQLDKRTISKYKSSIVKKHFGKRDGILLDMLLQQL